MVLTLPVSVSLRSSVINGCFFQRKKEVDRQINIEEELQKNKILKGVDTEKKHQHDKLMDEFRKAHRKMFNSLGNGPAKDENDAVSEINENVAAIEVGFYILHFITLVTPAKVGMNVFVVFFLPEISLHHAAYVNKVKFSLIFSHFASKITNYFDANRQIL